MKHIFMNQLVVALTFTCTPSVAAESPGSAGVARESPKAQDAQSKCTAAAEQINGNIIERMERETGGAFKFRWSDLKLSGKLRDVRPKYPRRDKNEAGPSCLRAQPRSAVLGPT
jgi:hypothetical protein